MPRYSRHKSNNTPGSKNKNQTTPSFICELPLRATPRDIRTANARIEAARQVRNACLGEALKRAELLRESRAYQRALRLPEGKERSAAFKNARRAAGFTDAALQRYAVRLRQRAFKKHLDVHVAQKMGSRMFNAVNDWLLGKRGRPRFKGYRQMDTVEGKSNDTGIRWRDGVVEWMGLRLPAIIDPSDPVVAHALDSRVKYVRLVRRKINGHDRLYTQLVCEGLPYRKPSHEVGSSDVGLDIGPSTIAAVSEDKAVLVPFCEEVVRDHAEIRRLQRKLDRQQRANNPQNYLPDGRIKPGPKKWIKSNRQIKIQDRLAELLRRESAHRKTLHGQLANRILAMGKVIKTEKVSYRGFQRKYGRSVGVRAPGMFVSILRRKAESAGGRVIEFSTHTTRLSQVCHCGKTEKKSLSQRIHRCSCGVEMQRDLYSAFLARCVGEDNLLHADLASSRWSGAEPLLWAAWGRATQPASGRLRPSSFGAMPWSQSGSPAELRTARTEVRDAVAHTPCLCQVEKPTGQRVCGESPDEVKVFFLRTPWL
jgi:putative transposase